MAKGELTKAQRELLNRAADYADGAPSRARPLRAYSAPMRRLVRRGLVEIHPHKMLPHWSLVFATTSGRAALSAQEDGRGE